MRKRKKQPPMVKCRTCESFVPDGDDRCDFCLAAAYRLKPDIPAGDGSLDEPSYSLEAACKAIRMAELSRLV